MCLPLIAGIASAASGIIGAAGAHQDAQAQADYQNESAIRNYKYQLAKREGEWNKTLSIWGNKKVDYQNEYSANAEAADRSYAAEQYRLNEMFQQAAFQKQDMLAQLIQSTGSIGASERTGKTVKRLETAQLAAFGRNNAVVAENLASARNAMINRNEDYRLQLQSANNRAWSNVAIAPTPDTPPPQPVMAPGPSGLGLAAGIAGGIASGIGAFNSLKAPSAGNWGTDGLSKTAGFGQNDWGGSKAFNPSGFDYKMPKGFNPSSNFGDKGTNGFNYFNSKLYFGT